MFNSLFNWDFLPARKPRKKGLTLADAVLTEKVTALQEQASHLIDERNELIVERDGLKLQVEALQAAYADLTIAYDTLNTRHEHVSDLTHRAVLLLQQLSPTRKPSQALMGKIVTLLADAQEAGIVGTEKQGEESHA